MFGKPCSLNLITNELKKKLKIILWTTNDVHLFDALYPTIYIHG